MSPWSNGRPLVADEIAPSTPDHRPPRRLRAAAVLARLAAWIDAQRAKKQPGIITCSALKRSYRDIVIGDRPEARLVYLRGGRDLLAGRMASRAGHFFPPSLLQSQLDTLEEPDPSEDPLTVDLGPPAAEIAGAIIRLLGAASTVRRA